MRTATVRAFAKINLGLKVLGLRSDGFHELRTIYQSISLFDTVKVSVSKRGSGPQVVLLATGLEVPAGSDNLAVRAASAMCAATETGQQVQIHLTKRIPTGGGLGGGSSDAAAVIRALNLLLKKKLSASQLFQVAGKLGSDVPFFLFGGRAVGVGRGEEVYPLPDGATWNCVLALPGEGMSTAEAYRGLRAKPWPPVAQPGNLSTSPAPQPTIESFSAALLSEAGNHSDRLLPMIENDFQPLLFGKFPQLARANRALLKCGAVQAALTGSGSAIFGFFSTRPQALTGFRKLENSGLRVYLARTVNRRQYAHGLRLG